MASFKELELTNVTRLPSVSMNGTLMIEKNLSSLESVKKYIAKLRKTIKTLLN